MWNSPCNPTLKILLSKCPLNSLSYCVRVVLVENKAKTVVPLLLTKNHYKRDLFLNEKTKKLKWSGNYVGSVSYLKYWSGRASQDCIPSTTGVFFQAELLWRPYRVSTDIPSLPLGLWAKYFPCSLLNFLNLSN